MRKRETSPCFFLFVFFFVCDKDLSTQSLNAVICTVFVLWEKTMTQQFGNVKSRRVWGEFFLGGGGIVEVNVLAVCLWYCLCSSVQHVYIRHSCTTTRLRAEKLTSTCVSLDLHASVFMCVWDGSVCVCVWLRPRLMCGGHARWRVCIQPVHQSVSRTSRGSEGLFLFFSLQEERLLWKQLGL